MPLWLQRMGGDVSKLNRDLVESVGFDLLVNRVLASPFVPSAFRVKLLCRLGLNVLGSRIRPGVRFENRNVKIGPASCVGRNVRFVGIAPIELSPGAIVPDGSIVGNCSRLSVGGIF